MTFPNGKAEIIAIYGQPCHVPPLVEVSLPASIGITTSVHVHPLIAEAVRNAFQAVYDDGNWDTLKTFDGCYCCRTKRGIPGDYSVHSWAVALDLNAHTNPLGAEPITEPPLDDSIFHEQHPVVIAFKAQGFTWGGDFHGRRDPMHFQAASGY